MQKDRNFKQCREFGDQSAHEFLPKFCAVPNHPEGAWQGSFENVSASDLLSLVHGVNRCKYFNRPLTKLAGFDIRPNDSNKFWWFGLREPDPIELVTSGTQTDFRENEAQTEPWDPPFKTPPPSPLLEVTTLSELQYGKGLPAGPGEIEDIILSRETREWEAKVPPVSCNRQEMVQRHNMIAKQRIKELNRVRDKIHNHYQQKYEDAQMSLATKMQQREDRKNYILENLFKIKKQDLKKKTNYLRDYLMKRLKNIDRKRSVFTQKLDFSDIQPLAGSSSVQTTVPEKSALEQFYLESSKGLVDLERWMWEEQKLLMEPEIYGPKRPRKQTRLERIIEQAEEAIVTSGHPASEDVDSKTLRRDVMGLVRPPTPTSPAADLEYVERDSSIILIQQLLRGRAVLKEVLGLCGHYQNLIDELLGIHPVMKQEQVLVEKKKTDDAVRYLEEKILTDQEMTRLELLARFEGKVLSNELNVLGKCVERHGLFNDIKRIVDQAKEERRHREAEEAGRRQQEILQQHILDTLFKEIHGRVEDDS